MSMVRASEDNSLTWANMRSSDSSLLLPFQKHKGYFFLQTFSFIRETPLNSQKRLRHCLNQ